MERVRPGTILAGGLSAAVAALLLTIPATGLVDAVLVAVAAVLAGGTAWTWNEARRLAVLPLEVAGTGGTGVIDGVTVYRFRLRLGHGRAFSHPEVRVAWEATGAAPVDLPTAPLPGVACGPLTVIVRDPAGHVGGTGTFRVRARVTSRGRGWDAEAAIPLGSVAPGRFAGLAMAGGRLSFADDWDKIRPE